MLKFGFKDLNLHRVYLHVFENNKIAIKLYENMKFSREGQLRDGVFIDGHYLDVVVMGILRDEYEG